MAGRRHLWWARRRAKIFDRDGWKCVRCGSTKDLTVDHILARSLGGTDWLGNLQTLCGTCNTNKARLESRLALDPLREVQINCLITECPFCGARYEGPGVRRIRPRISYFDRYERSLGSKTSEWAPEYYTTQLVSSE